MVFLWWSWWTIVALLVRNGRSSSLDWATSNDIQAIPLQRNANNILRNSGGSSSSSLSANNVEMLSLGSAMAEMHCALKLLSVMRAVCPMSANGGFNDDDDDDEDGRDQGDDVYAPSLALSVVDSCSSPLQTASRFCTSGSANAVRSSSSRLPSWSSGRLEERLQIRGRRQNGSEYPPGFYASRGRKSGTFEAEEQQQRDRKDETETPKLSNILKEGFIGWKG